MPKKVKLQHQRLAIKSKHFALSSAFLYANSNSSSVLRRTPQADSLHTEKKCLSYVWAQFTTYIPCCHKAKVLCIIFKQCSKSYVYSWSNSKPLLRVMRTYDLLTLILNHWVSEIQWKFTEFQSIQHLWILSLVLYWLTFSEFSLNLRDSHWFIVQ